MSVKDRLKQLGKIRVDFWNEGKPQSVTVNLPAPTTEPESKPMPRRRVRAAVTGPEVVLSNTFRPAPSSIPPAFPEPATFEPSPASVRLRKVLDEPPPAQTEWAPEQGTTLQAIPSDKMPRITAPTARSFRTETTTCPVCRQEVGAWQTYADGTVRCLPCSRHNRGGLHAV